MIIVSRAENPNTTQKVQHLSSRYIKRKRGSTMRFAFVVLDEMSPLNGLHKSFMRTRRSTDGLTLKQIFFF